MKFFSFGAGDKPTIEANESSLEEETGEIADESSLGEEEEEKASMDITSCPKELLQSTHSILPIECP